MHSIKKRGGEVVPFNSKKISDAISKANFASDDETFTSGRLASLTREVIKAIEADDSIPTVEEVQDAVERVLIRENYSSTAKAYILYRAERTKVREGKSNLMSIYDNLTFQDAKDIDIKRENANINADTAMGTMLKYGSEGSKYYMDSHILPKDIAKAHANGDIHIHKNIVALQCEL